jgi:hypothetical protein
LTPPPRLPSVALGENDGLGQVRVRLWQINAAAITVFLTGWWCTLGPIPAIVGLMVAKDVLVAILIMGVGCVPGDHGRVIIDEEHVAHGPLGPLRQRKKR